jgi:predicted transcriptional regulator
MGLTAYTPPLIENHPGSKKEQRIARSLQYIVIRHIIAYYGAIMSELKTVSFRIRTEAVETLDALAETMDRDRTYLLNEAVERYLELNEYHVKLIKKGLRAAEAGDFVPPAEMKKLIARMRRAK